MTAKSLACGIIRECEGLSFNAYPDPASGGDPWTIGYGATGPGIRPGVTWSIAQAEARLSEDIQRFMAGVSGLLKRKPTDSQLAAMTSLAFNIGLSAFGKSTLLRKFNAGDYKGAAAEFDRWVYASGKKMKGLERRRKAERALFESVDFSNVISGVTSTEDRA